jgi:hypothetical protein
MDADTVMWMRMTVLLALPVAGSTGATTMIGLSRLPCAL